MADDDQIRREQGEALREQIQKLRERESAQLRQLREAVRAAEAAATDEQEGDQR